jgi:hypothetical protein
VGGYNGPLITQITLIMDARPLQVAHTHGVSAQDWTNEEIYRKVAEVK